MFTCRLCHSATTRREHTHTHKQKKRSKQLRFQVSRSGALRIACELHFNVISLDSQRSHNKWEMPGAPRGLCVCVPLHPAQPPFTHRLSELNVQQPGADTVRIIVAATTTRRGHRTDKRTERGARARMREDKWPCRGCVSARVFACRNEDGECERGDAHARTHAERECAGWCAKQSVDGLTTASTRPTDRLRCKSVLELQIHPHMRFSYMNVCVFSDRFTHTRSHTLTVDNEPRQFIGFTMFQTPTQIRRIPKWGELTHKSFASCVCVCVGDTIDISASLMHSSAPVLPIKCYFMEQSIFRE